MPGMSAQSLNQARAQRIAAANVARQNTDTAHGSAAFASAAETAAAGKDGNLLTGRSRDSRLLTYGGNGHLLTFGPTGSGKGVSVVVPNLLTYPGSVVCIDPKGAIPAITAAQRRELGQEVVLLDPFAEVAAAIASRGQAHQWPELAASSVNPFGHLDATSPDVVDDVRLIAASLVVQEEGKNRFFSDSARMVLEGFILYLLAQTQGAPVTIDALFALAFSDPAEMRDRWLPQMQKCKDFGGHVAHLATLTKSLTGEGGAAVWSTLYRSLNLIKSPRLLPSMRPSAVDFRSIKTKPTTLYLVLPARHLQTHGVWLRLMLSVLIGQLSDARRSDYPVLFVVDECAALGRLEILETAVGLMRGYGLKLWLIFQDLPQLKGTYGDRWESFISNSGVKQFFNVNDLATADFVSQYLGNETLRVQSESINGPSQMPGQNLSAVGRPLLTSDEVRRLPQDEQILFYEGRPPMRSAKLRYYEDSEFKEERGGALVNTFSPDPYIVEEEEAAP